jgi:hypothetical protein
LTVLVLTHLHAFVESTKLYAKEGEFYCAVNLPYLQIYYKPF